MDRNNKEDIPTDSGKFISDKQHEKVGDEVRLSECMRTALSMKIIQEGFVSVPLSIHMGIGLNTGMSTSSTRMKRISRENFFLPCNNSDRISGPQLTQTFFDLGILCDGPKCKSWAIFRINTSTMRTVVASYMASK